MNRNLFLDSSSTESDVFYVERSSEEGSLIRNNTLSILSSGNLSGAMAVETITISSVASLEPQIVTIDSDSNKPTFQHFNTGSVINIQLCHPALMISTCRTTHSMCWLLWSSFDKRKSTAPNHRSRLIRLQSLRPQRI